MKTEAYINRIEHQQHITCELFRGLCVCGRFVGGCAGILLRKISRELRRVRNNTKGDICVIVQCGVI